MKRFYIPFLLMAAAAVAACNNKVVIDEPALENGSYVFTLKASAPDVDTKTDYSSTGKFSWGADDQISVLFHNGTENKFFTLTNTSGAGASADFSGTIDEGYEIGASNGTESDKMIWALFPASDSHIYNAETSSPEFYVQPNHDFSTASFSANIPMCSRLEQEGTLSFQNLACTYKFTLTDLRVSKVKVVVYNKTTYGLSGSWPITEGDAGQYINYGYASPGSANSTLTFISEATDSKVVFYVPCRYWGTFQPDITVFDAETDAPLKHVSASVSKTPSSMTKVQPLTISVPEAPFVPAITIDGDMSDWDSIETLASVNTSRINEWKFKSDGQFVYLYFKLRGDRIAEGRKIYIGFDIDNDSATGQSYGNVPGCDRAALVIPITGSSSPYTFINGYDPDSQVYVSGTTVETGGIKTASIYDEENTKAYVEVRITRDILSLPASGTTISIGCSYDWYVTGMQSLTLE